MKKLSNIIALMFLTNVCVAQFNANKTRYHLPQIGFKDGTVLKNVKIRFVFDDGPTTMGIILHSSDDRVYFHHYPYRPPERLQGSMSDEYATPARPQLEEKAVRYKYTEHYKPPKYANFNPVHIPQCCPSRIPFIHFNKATLNTLYKVFLPMGKANQNNWSHFRVVNGTIKKAAWHKPRAYEMNTRKESLLWQGKVEREMRLSWPKIYYGKWYLGKK